MADVKQRQEDQENTHEVEHKSVKSAIKFMVPRDQRDKLFQQTGLYLSDSTSPSGTKTAITSSASVEASSAKNINAAAATKPSALKGTFSATSTGTTIATKPSALK